MNVNFFHEVMDIVADILKKETFFQKKDSNHGWYEKRKYFLEQNEAFLKKVQKELNKKYENTYTIDDLFSMQKLFFLYPEEPPMDLLELSWENIKVLLNLCDATKRQFYINICTFKNMDTKTLETYILNDFYEKVLAVTLEMEEKVSLDEKFLNQVFEIYSMVWQ